MTFTARIPAIVLLLVSWSSMYYAHAQSTLSVADQPLVDELRQGLKAACSLKPMWLKYQLTEFNSAEYLKATSALKEASDIVDSALPSTFKDTETKIEIEFALKDNRQAYRKQGEGIWQVKEGAAVVKMRRAAVFNGLLAVSTDYQPDQFNPAATVYVTSRKASLVRKPALPTFLSFQEALLLQLEQYHSGDDQVKLGITDDSDSQHIQLVFSYPNNEQCSYWLDRTRKCAVTRCEHIQNPNVRTESSTRYRDVNGVPFPSEIQWIKFVDSDKPAWRQSYTLRSLEVDGDKIPNALFHIDIPAGSALYDKDSGTWQR